MNNSINMLDLIMTETSERRLRVLVQEFGLVRFLQEVDTKVIDRLIHPPDQPFFWLVEAKTINCRLVVQVTYNTENGVFTATIVDSRLKTNLEVADWMDDIQLGKNLDLISQIAEGFRGIEMDVDFDTGRVIFYNQTWKTPDSNEKYNTFETTFPVDDNSDCIALELE